MALADAGHGRHDLARRAIAALEGVLFEEGSLHGMQFALPRKPLYGGDGTAFGLGGERQAGQHALAVDMNGAGAALTLVAALLGAGEAEMFTQRVEQRDARLDVERMALAVDVEMNAGHGRLAPTA